MLQTSLNCGMRIPPCDLCRYYLEAFCKDEQQSRQLAEALEAAVTAELVQPEAHGLTRPQH